MPKNQNTRSQSTNDVTNVSNVGRERQGGPKTGKKKKGNRRTASTTNLDDVVQRSPVSADNGGNRVPRIALLNAMPDHRTCTIEEAEDWHREYRLSLKNLFEKGEHKKQVKKLVNRVVEATRELDRLVYAVDTDVQNMRPNARAAEILQKYKNLAALRRKVSALKQAMQRDMMPIRQMGTVPGVQELWNQFKSDLDKVRPMLELSKEVFAANKALLKTRLHDASFELEDAIIAAGHINEDVKNSEDEQRLGPPCIEAWNDPNFR